MVAKVYAPYFNWAWTGPWVLGSCHPNKFCFASLFCFSGKKEVLEAMGMDTRTNQKPCFHGDPVFVTRAMAITTMCFHIWNMTIQCSTLAEATLFRGSRTVCSWKFFHIELDSRWEEFPSRSRRAVGYLLKEKMCENNTP